MSSKIQQTLRSQKLSREEILAMIREYNASRGG